MRALALKNVKRNPEKEKPKTKKEMRKGISLKRKSPDD